MTVDLIQEAVRSFKDQCWGSAPLTWGGRSELLESTGMGSRYVQTL